MTYLTIFSLEYPSTENHSESARREPYLSPQNEASEVVRVDESVRLRVD